MSLFLPTAQSLPPIAVPQVLEYDLKTLGGIMTRAFEIVLVSSCQGVQTFMFKYFYVPSVFAMIWVAANIACIIGNCWNSGIGSDPDFPGIWDAPKESNTWKTIFVWSFELLLWVRFLWFVMLCLYARWELKRQSYLRTRCRQLAFQMVLTIVVPKELIFLIGHVYSGLPPVAPKYCILSWVGRSLCNLWLLK